MTRGGSWSNTAVTISSSYRPNGTTTDIRSYVLGFRVARTLLTP
jgi:formylglycine-generating enzyme required for sulfatase activity